MRDGIRFNPLAIASAGIAYLWVRFGHDEDRRTLIELAARSNPASAHGFAASYEQIAAADARMPAAILRCSLKAAIAPAHRYDCTPEQLSAVNATQADRARTAVDFEIAWLAGRSEEPAWTELPPHDHIHRRSIRIGPARNIEDEDKDEVPEEAGGWRFDAQAGALWLKSVAAQMAADQAASLAALVLAYADWTARANGLGLQVDRDLSSAPDECRSVAASASLFLDGLLGDERRKTGWMRAEAAGDPGPWRQQAILGRGRWDAEALRDIVREYVAENLATDDAVLVIDETGFLKQGKASCGVARQYTGSAGWR